MRNIRGFPNIKADVTLRFSASLLEGRREYSLLIVRDSKRGIVRLLGQLGKLVGLIAAINISNPSGAER